MTNSIYIFAPLVIYALYMRYKRVYVAVKDKDNQRVKRELFLTAMTLLVGCFLLFLLSK